MAEEPASNEFDSTSSEIERHGEKSDEEIMESVEEGDEGVDEGAKMADIEADWVAERELELEQNYGDLLPGHTPEDTEIFRDQFIQNRREEEEKFWRMEEELRSDELQVQVEMAFKQMGSLSADKDLTKPTINQQMMRCVVAIRDQTNAWRALLEEK